jgi:hypothetical protein
LRKVSYTNFVNSDVPEEIILSILCNFNEEEASSVLAKIISSLQKISQDSIVLEKYIKQILVFSRLRDLTILTNKQLKNMGLVYDIEKDALYQEGKIEGEFKITIKGIQKAILQNKLTLEDIAGLFEVSLDFIKKVKSGEIK